MAKNDSILVDGIIAQNAGDGLPSSDIGEVFEYFSFQQILKNYDLTDDELETGWIDGRHDGGIDGFFIFVNGHLVSDMATFQWPRSHAQVDVFVISCKHHDTFKESTVNSLLATVQELFDLARDNSQLNGAYSKELLNARQRLADVYKRLAITSPEVHIRFVYASRGDSADIGESVRARSNQITQSAKTLFSGINVTFEFLGAKELIQRYRVVKQFALELPFQDHLVGTGEGYIIIAKLIDYYRFVCDDKGALRRYLFDSNVRDYLGNNKVNEDIAFSLTNESVPDFWWLNNGITILATKAIINGKNMQMQDIQVVNGLQTTESIYRHFNAGSKKSSERTLSIKVIVSTDERLRDQIIRATNNQSIVEQASLHATDKIQRDIEQILEKYDFYYERRKNYYRHIGRPAARFATPLFVAVAFVAIMMKDPATAAVLKSRFMRDQKSYGKVFSDRVPIEVWPILVAVLKAVEEEMLRAPSHGEGFLRGWRGLIGFLFVSKLIGRFDFGQTEVLGLDISNIDKALISTCFKFVQSRRRGLVRPSQEFVRQVCGEFGSLYSLPGVESVGRTRLPIPYGKRASVVLADGFVDQVDTLLPLQPWQQGVHIEVAQKLDVPRQFVTSAIQQLIDSGRRYAQVDGALFDREGNRVSQGSR